MKDHILGPGTEEWNGTTYKTILATAATQGALSVVDSVSPPNSGPPRHVHDDADETFVVLTGDVHFWCDGEVFTRGPGETAFIPKGTPHTFRVSGGGASRHLVILTPGGFEGFFSEMAGGQFRIPEDMEAIVESGARHHLRFVGPPLEAAEGGE